MNPTAADSKKHTLVVTAGEVVVDWLSTTRGRCFDDAESFYRGLGGNAANVAVGLCRLGTPSRLLAKIGRDIHGEFLRKKLQAEQVDIECLLVDESVPSAQCYGFEDLDGEHTYYNWPRPHAAQMLSAEDIHPEALSGARFLHTTGISFTLDPRKSAIEKVMKLADERGLVVSFDANSPTEIGWEAQQVVEGAFSLAHLLKLNRLELIYWSKTDGKESLESAASRLFTRYKPIALAVTLGADGSFIVTQQGTVHCPPLPVNSVCGVAAGDGFVAGLLHCLLKECGNELTKETLKSLKLDSWLRCGLYANAVGGLVTTRQGAAQAFPCALEVESLLTSSQSRQLR